jgi:cytochrome P450
MATTTAAPPRPPSPPAHPLWGHAKLLLQEGPASGAIEPLFAAHGDGLRLRVGPPVVGRHINLFRSPAAVRDVLAGQDTGFSRTGHPFFEQILELFGHGLFMVEGEEWKVQRRVLQPLFTAKAVEASVVAMQEVSADIADRLARDGGLVDLDRVSRELSLRIATRVLFGIDDPALARRVGEVFGPASAYVVRRAFAPVKPPRRTPVGWVRSGEVATAKLQAIVADVTRQAEANGGALINRVREAVDPETGDRFSEEVVQAQVLTFLVAGHETTSTALSMALHLLGTHPHVQEEAADEVAASGIPATPKAATSLPFTTAVLDETMRLYPPAYGTGRIAQRDVVVDGRLVSGGEGVFVSFMALHRHPDLWPDALTFDPQRFVDQPALDRERFTYVPFGAGPRSCIGSHFAVLEAQIALSTLLDRVRVRSRVREVGFTADITLSPSTPMPAEVTAR